MKKLFLGLFLTGTLLFAAEAQFGGNKAKAIRTIADQDTDRFIIALKETINEHFASDSAGKTAFQNLFMAKLRLDSYSGSLENVELFEKLRTKLEDENYTPASIDEAMSSIISTLVLEGEGE